MLPVDLHAIPPPRSVLIIRMSGIGDVLWTTPLLTNLRRAWPDAHIAYVVRTSSALVLTGNPDVDELILFEKEDVSWQIGLLARLARRRFDLSIDLICSPATALQSFVAARMRIGFDFRGRRHLYTHALPAREANAGHAVEFNLAPAAFLGVPVTARSLTWRVLPMEEEDARTALDRLGIGDRRFVTFIPTGGFPSKKWPVDHYAALASRIIGDSDLDVLIVWGNEVERADAGRIAREAGIRAHTADAWSLRTTAAVMAHSTAVIGNDTGPLHIATALGLPVIALLGPVNDRAQGPWSTRAARVRALHLDEPCCGRLICDNPRCMTGITADQVHAVLDAMLHLPEPSWPSALAPLGTRFLSF